MCSLGYFRSVNAFVPQSMLAKREKERIRGKLTEGNSCFGMEESVAQKNE